MEWQVSWNSCNTQPLYEICSDVCVMGLLFVPSPFLYLFFVYFVGQYASYSLIFYHFLLFLSTTLIFPFLSHFSSCQVFCSLFSPTFFHSCSFSPLFPISLLSSFFSISFSPLFWLLYLFYFYS